MNWMLDFESEISEEKKEFPAGADPHFVTHERGSTFVYVEGWDRDRVLKVLSEQRAIVLSLREGI